jgi:hypothetical protein
MAVDVVRIAGLVKVRQRQLYHIPHPSSDEWARNSAVEVPLFVLVLTCQLFYLGGSCQRHLEENGIVSSDRWRDVWCIRERRILRWKICNAFRFFRGFAST